MRLIIVRHGNTFEANQSPVMVGRTDLPLTEKGHQQAQMLAQHFKKHAIHPASFYSGSLKRQVQTLEPLHHILNPNAIGESISSLDEVDYGDWEGLTIDQIQAQWPDKYKQFHECGKWPEGLFRPAFEVKVSEIKQWLDSLKSKHKDNDTVMAVSSQGIIRMLLYFMPDLWCALKDNHDMSSYKVKTGHYCALIVSNNALKIDKWNQSPEG